MAAPHMQSDVFEDFTSDDDNGDVFGGDESDGDASLSDDQIANVLDLMAESSMTRLNSILHATSETDACGMAQCDADSQQSKRYEEEGSTQQEQENDVFGGAEPQAALEVLVQRDEEDASVRTSRQPSASTVAQEAPSAFTLLEELFPPPRQESARVPTTDLLALDPACGDEEQRIGDHTSQMGSSAEKRPDWMSLLDEMYGSSASETLGDGQVTPLEEASTGVDPASNQRSDPFLVCGNELSPPTLTASREVGCVTKMPQSQREDTRSVLPLGPMQKGESERLSAPSMSSSLDGNLSCSSLTWGRFSPGKMAVRRSSESLCLVKSSNRDGREDKTKLCYVPLHRPQTRRMRPRVQTPADLELTFRPKINARYFKRLRSRRRAVSEGFSRRMEKDILQRQQRKMEREHEKEKQKEAADQSGRRSLVAKGSERILHKNGLWEESFEKRLARLMAGSSGIKPQSGQQRSEKSKSRQRKRRQRAAATASRACESLYQRGLDKQRRDQKRQDEYAMSLRRSSARPKINPQSQLVMKKKLRCELELVCYGPKTDAQRRQDARDAPREPQRGKDKWLTFVEFSCALLYFGLVPDLETPLDGDEKVTLLWHAWRVFAKEHAEGQKQIAMSTLERILGTVILGGIKVPANDYQQQQDCERQQGLIQVFRVNYLSRKRLRAVDFRKVYGESSEESKKANPAQTSSTGSKWQQRKYSLHGKPMTSSPAHDPLSQRQLAAERRIKELRKEKEEQEVAECTFRPQISRSHSSEWNCDLRLMSVYGRQYKSSATKTTFDRLYDDASQRQNNVLEKYFQAKLEKEEQQKKEAAISASYVNGLAVEERLQNLQAALARNPLPVNFYKKIETMRSAADAKAQDIAAKARRLLPVQFQKSKDGRTIVVPFQLATELRASSHPSRRRLHDKASKKKTRDLVHGALNQLRNEMRPELESDVPNGAIHEEQIEDADFCLDVHLSPSEVRQLYFRAGDNPTQVAAWFARQHGLDKDQQVCLAEVLEVNLEKLFDLQF